MLRLKGANKHVTYNQHNNAIIAEGIGIKLKVILKNLSKWIKPKIQI